MPHLKSSNDYSLTSIPYTPLAYVTPGGTEDPRLYDDDEYSAAIDLPFNFCFYDSVFNKVVVGSNGLITFDPTNASCKNAYTINPTIPFCPNGVCPSGNQCVQAATYYPKAAIMAAYSDLDPRPGPTSGVNASPSDRKIEWRVEGTAPCRKFIVSFYRIGTYGANSCGLITPNSFQIIIYESTGLVDIFIGNKSCVSTSSLGKAILGIQNWNRDKAVAAAGRNATNWSASNEGWRFVPSGGTSRFMRAELCDFSGNIIHTTTAADTTTTTPGFLDINFPNNLCPSGNQEQYIVKTYFSSCEGGAPMVSNDTVTIRKTANLNPTSTTTPSNCAPNGTLTVTLPTGIGTPPFSASLNGGAPQTFSGSSHTFTGLFGGNYSVYVQDASGCFQTLNVTVASSGTLNVNSTTTATSCPGSASGTITLTPQNGTAPYQYQLNGGSWQASNVFTGVSAGTHNVVIRDATGCQRSITVTVSNGPGMTSNFTASPTSCAGANNGSITITPGSGTAPYQYAITSVNGGAYQASNTFSNLAPGTYFYNIIDAAGCQLLNQMAWVSAGGALTGTASSSSTSCAGINNGSITATPTSGSGPYTYSLNGGAYQSSNTFTNLAPGSYTVTIRDGAGCVSNSIAVTVAQGSPLLATTSATPTSCNGATNGTITASPSNGTAPYQYQLNGGAFQNSNSFGGLAAGNYTIVVRDAAGCTTAPLSVTVAAGPPPTASVAVTNVSCFNTTTGSATVTVANTGTYQYSLNGTTYQASNIFSGLPAGNYTVYFRDNNNCNGTQNFTITEPSALSASAVKQDVKCFGANDGVITASGSGGTTPYQYSINGSTYQASNTFNVIAGTYTIYVRDANGCIQTSPVTVAQPSLLTATSDTTNATCNGGPDGRIRAFASGGTSPYQYSVNGGTTYQSSNVFSVAPGMHTITIKDANGCITTVTDSVGMTNDMTLTPASDHTICEGDSVQLVSQSNALQYVWTPGNSNIIGGNTSSPTVYPTTTTDYYLLATFGRCVGYDTLTVFVNPAPIADAGTNGDICYGQKDTLQGGGGVMYMWSPSTYLNSATVQNPVSSADKTIEYSLHVTDANGCRSLQADKVTVNVTPPIVVRISKDTIVAKGDSFQLFASSLATDYIWTPDINLSDATIPTPDVRVENDIKYTVVATTSAGCRGEASVVLKVYNGPDFYIPTAFTPNNDRLNDTFFPFPVGIKSLTYFKVFNRWGDLVFSTNKLFDGWDGTIKGVLQPAGAYVWMVEGITKEGKKVTKRGTVVIIR